jgi:hypothetical protein
VSFGEVAFSEGRARHKHRSEAKTDQGGKNATVPIRTNCRGAIDQMFAIRELFFIPISVNLSAEK